jgi:PAS domain S-box-containing protein
MKGWGIPEAERAPTVGTLAENGEQFRKIFEDAYLGIVITSPSFAFEKVNPAFSRMMGYSADELRSMTFADITHPDHLLQDSENVNRVGRGEMPFYQVEKRYIDKNGKVLWGDLFVSGIRDEHGALRYYLSMVNDITERKKVEEDLRKTEETYRLVVDNMADVIAVMDLDLRFTYVSPSVIRLLGYPAEETMALPLEKIMTPESLQIVTSVFEEELKLEADGRAEPGRTRTLELQECKKDGSLVWVENRLSWLRDNEKRLVGIIALCHDITDRRKSDKQLKDTLGSLRKAIGATIHVMVSAVEARDPYTAGHQLRSANIARAIATEMGLPRERIDGIRIAGSVHDIGKLSIPAEILSKPTRLSELEFSLIKEHVLSGYEILKNVESPWPLAQIVYQHHERMDGSGYPRHLKGEEILMDARILAVADVVEAMASHRPYRPALGEDAALKEIEHNRGTLYDTDVVDACLRAFREKGFRFDRP